MKYKELLSEKTQPKFLYCLLTQEKRDNLDACCLDYYLYFNPEDFESAYNQLRYEGLAKGVDFPCLCTVEFNHRDRTYYLKPKFKWDCINQTVQYSEVGFDSMLHAWWHMRAGEWLNPPK